MRIKLKCSELEQHIRYVRRTLFVADPMLSTMSPGWQRGGRACMATATGGRLCPLQSVPEGDLAQLEDVFAEHEEIQFYPPLTECQSAPFTIAA